MTAPAAQQAEHRVQIATDVIVGKARQYACNCSCGWGSPLCATTVRMRELFAEHVERETQAAGRA